jgi:hypothetical protein
VRAWVSTVVLLDSAVMSAGHFPAVASEIFAVWPRMSFRIWREDGAKLCFVRLPEDIFVEYQAPKIKSSSCIGEDVLHVAFAQGDVRPGSGAEGCRRSQGYTSRSILASTRPNNALILRQRGIGNEQGGNVSDAICGGLAGIMDSEIREGDKSFPQILRSAGVNGQVGSNLSVSHSWTPAITLLFRAPA